MTRGRRSTSNSDRQSVSSYSHTQSSDLLYSGPLLWLFPATCTLVCTYDNFQVTLLLDACKGYQEWSTGIVQVAFCLFIMAVKVFESLKVPTGRANFRIYRDTTVIVIISYVLLLDINLSNLWLSIFPAIAIVFIWMLCTKLCPPSEAGERADSSSGNHGPTALASKKALKETISSLKWGAWLRPLHQLMHTGLLKETMATTLSFFALLGMAQLHDSTANRFAISQFLLFLSTTLGALTNMMMRLPAGISPGIVPASELLRKAFLLIVLVTLHTVAAEGLRKDLVWICMLELFPVLLWYSVHLDRHGPIVSIHKIKPHQNSLIAYGAVVIALLAYSIEEFGLYSCTSIMMACGLSGVLTYYVVFLLHQWPGQQSAAGNNVQSEEQAASSDEAVQLLKFWANALLIVAAALLPQVCYRSAAWPARATV
uniref:Uncharacterized protein n=4 Tax=Avena sativa TaxID=4498 RepID=A0ACD5YI62_AVESA